MGKSRLGQARQIIGVLMLVATLGGAGSIAHAKDFPAAIDLPATTPRVETLGQLQLHIRAANELTQIPADITPTPWHANDRSIIYADGCMENRDVTVRSKCVFGDKTARREMWLIGDSHAAQWFYTVQAYALKHHYKLVVHANSNCELTHPIAKKIAWSACTGLNRYWRHHIKVNRPDLVLVGLYQGWTKRVVPQVQSALKLLAKSAKHVVLIGDTSRRNPDTRQCLKANTAAVKNCSMAITDGIDFVTASRLKRGASANHYLYLDTHDWLCQQGKCPAIAANLILYRDYTHITGVAATWLIPIFDVQLNALL